MNAALTVPLVEEPHSSETSLEQDLRSIESRNRQHVRLLCFICLCVRTRVVFRWGGGHCAMAPLFGSPVMYEYLKIVRKIEPCPPWILGRKSGQKNGLNLSEDLSFWSSIFSSGFCLPFQISWPPPLSKILRTPVGTNQALSVCPAAPTHSTLFEVLFGSLSSDWPNTTIRIQHLIKLFENMG